MRWFWRILSACFVVVALATALTWRGADPRLYPPVQGQGAVAIEVVSNGFHSGLALPTVAMGQAAGRLGLPGVAAIARRFAAFPVLEIGWGEARFYRSTPTLDSIDVWLALSALFRPGNASVVHVVGLPDRAVRVLAVQIVPITLSEPGFDALLRRLDQALAKGAASPLVELGPGLARNSLFYASVETFSIVQVCNHWTSSLLSAAGVPTVGAWATLPDGLILDLRWHAGLPVVEPAAAVPGVSLAQAADERRASRTDGRHGIVLAAVCRQPLYSRCPRLPGDDP